MHAARTPPQRTPLGGHRGIAPIHVADTDGDLMVRVSRTEAECPDCGKPLAAGPHHPLGVEHPDRPDYAQDPNLYWCRTPGCEPLAACDVLVEWNQIATTSRGTLVVYDYEPTPDPSNPSTPGA